uniref:Cytochrome P450 CYP71AT87 n=1 Tax=Plectranthus barbatus TaxID=41228 RepID=A0A1B0VTE0_9LAMI|nr:cytochrome P450 CYP71AT87 [Plectranthus barbatus]
MMQLVAAPLLSLIIILIMVLSTMGKKKKNPNRNPPGPRGLPLVGNLFQFDSSKPIAYLQQLNREYGPLVYLNHASTPTLVISSTKLVKQILKSHDSSFCTRPPVLGQQKLSYDGSDMAFSPYNAHWKDTRKMCVLHLFSPKQVLSFRPIREAQVGRMMEKVSAAAGASKAANMSEIAMSMASNIICGVAFGRTYDDEEYEKKKLDRMVLEAQALMVSFYFSDHFPALGWVDKVSGLLGRLDRNFKEMDGFYQQLIEEHLDPAAPKREREDIIDLMIQLKRQKPESITLDHIKALLMNIFVAGTDTAAAVVVWTMTALMLRPTVMKKTQMQIRQAMGKNKGTIDEDDIGKLPYLKAVVLESLRLYPPAPLLYRTPVNPGYSLDIDGYEIKPGSHLIINGWAIARDPETWENPDEFVPERFLMNDDGGGVKEYVEFEMIPFGGGRRGCPGMGMGLVSVELALANLLYSFDWSLPQSPDAAAAAAVIDCEALPGLTMHKKNPLLLRPAHYLPPSSAIM